LGGEVLKYEGEFGVDERFVGGNGLTAFEGELVKGDEFKGEEFGAAEVLVCIHGLGGTEFGFEGELVKGDEIRGEEFGAAEVLVCIHGLGGTEFGFEGVLSKRANCPSELGDVEFDEELLDTDGFRGY
jgi:predicted esterase